MANIKKAIFINKGEGLNLDSSKIYTLRYV